jgi:hypothetical protein
MSKECKKCLYQIMEMKSLRPFNLEMNNKVTECQRKVCLTRTRIRNEESTLTYNNCIINLTNHPEEFLLATEIIDLVPSCRLSSSDD